MRFPIPPSEFDALEDDVLVQIREFVSSDRHRGIYPFSKDTFLRAVKAGDAAEPVVKRPGAPNLWRVGDVRNAIAKLEGVE